MLNARSLIQSPHTVSRTRQSGGFQFDQLSDCSVCKHMWVSLFIFITDYRTKHKKLVVFWASQNWLLTLRKHKLVWARILIAAVFCRIYIDGIMEREWVKKATCNFWRWNWLLPRPQTASIAIIATSLLSLSVFFLLFCGWQKLCLY
jgi:hypothetical protein